MEKMKKETSILVDMINAEGFDYALNNFYHAGDIAFEDAVLAAKIDTYITWRDSVIEYFRKKYGEEVDG